MQTLVGNESPLADLEASVDETPFVDALSIQSPVVRRWLGPAYRFPLELPSGEGTVLLQGRPELPFAPALSSWLPDLTDCQLCVGVMVDDQVVGICASVRISAGAHEAGVETAPDWRGQGCARRAVSGWARAVRGVGAIPVYSTSWENAASLATASSIGLVQFGVNFHLT